jgi:metalloprotease ARX1
VFNKKMSMELELTSEQKVLIDQKNVLINSTVDKYRLAGQIAQTALTYIQTLLRSPNAQSKTIGELCRLGDLFIQKAVDVAYKKGVQEKGIALPVQIEKGSFVSGMSPELGDKFQGDSPYDGDIIKITLGVHIDGYTAQVCHTMVLNWEPPQQPLMGSEADAIIAAHLATEAVLNLVSLTLSPNRHPLVTQNGLVTGQRIRSLVEDIAGTFRVKVVPGSRVRRVRRFLAGQHEAVHEQDFKGVVWDEHQEELREVSRYVARLQGKTDDDDDDQREDAEREDFVVVPGEVWLVDIRMAATDGEKGVLRCKDVVDPETTAPYRPTIYGRDYTVTYGLKLNASRTLVSKVAAATSVYPFKLSYLSEDSAELRANRLGLNEIVQHHMFVGVPIQRVEFVPITAFENGSNMQRSSRNGGGPVAVAREMATLVLVPGDQSRSGFAEALRLTGGQQSAPPSWVHSRFKIGDDEINQILAVSKEKKQLLGVSFQAVQSSKLDQGLFDESGVVEEGLMDVD